MDCPKCNSTAYTKNGIVNDRQRYKCKSCKIIMKACQIYKTKKEYKIVTMYQTDTGTYILSTPIFILPVNVDTEIFKCNIFNSLNESKGISYTEEISSKELLKSMKKQFFRKLYRNSTSCSIYFENNLIAIEPNQCVKLEEGLEPVKKDFVEMTYSKDRELDITRKVIEILEYNYES